MIIFFSFCFASATAALEFYKTSIYYLLAWLTRVDGTVDGRLDLDKYKLEMKNGMMFCFQSIAAAVGDL